MGSDWNPSDATYQVTIDNVLGASEESYAYEVSLFDSGIEPEDSDKNGQVNGADFLRWQTGQSLNPLSSGELEAWQESFVGSAESEALLSSCLSR